MSLPARAEPCSTGGCPAAKPSKPLDILKFMREQAASTRAGERKVARKPVHRAKPRPAAAKPAPVPTEAAASFAAQPPPEVEEVSADDLNAIDRAGEAAPPEIETVGKAPDPPAVQVVEAESFNDIDRKAQDAAPPPNVPAPAPAPAGSESHSWLGWLWSAFKGTFAALAMAVHQLIG